MSKNTLPSPVAVYRPKDSRVSCGAISEPFSHQVQQDARQTELNRQVWTNSSSFHSRRKNRERSARTRRTGFRDLVFRLASLAEIAYQIDYRRRIS